MSFVHWIATMKNQQNRHPGKEPQGRNPQQQQQQMEPQPPHKGGKQQEQRTQKHPQQR
ncbi:MULTISPECIES: lana protein [Stenotrophomonas]|uniref:lana protein n=1 Tax=Stenotrophomonas TaxID=40323 RepID=UPI0007F042E4|nr:MULTISPECIES: lana protein [Stenotrophomonas]MCF3527004.1 lana protein [Stenotrophomonas maltophilia]MCF3554167.1 lana protein [Stenotrophomonas maltophilia]MCU1056805.1 lana protein [Stenotrophomonas maltophilia]MDH1662942.1 lana protein [Stenotrophomonas sp. GD03777]OBU52377.1 lana protein [Stenotrophomonas maltophilia]